MKRLRSRPQEPSRQFVAPMPPLPKPPRPRIPPAAWLPLLVCNLTAGLCAAVVYAARVPPVDPAAAEGSLRTTPAASSKRHRGRSARRATARPKANPEAARGARQTSDEEADASPPLTAPPQRDEKTHDEDGLTVQRIIDRVTEQVSVVEPCLQQAAAVGVLAYDVPHRLIVDFVIDPEGNVRDTRLVGPTHVLGSTLAECMEAAMKAWRFPESARGAPVRNFPFGPFTIHAPGTTP